MFAIKVTEAINAFLLWLAMLPTGFYKKIGVDVPQLFAILQYKLMIDNRRPLTFKSKKKDTANTNSTFSLMIMSLLYGFLFLIAFSAEGLLVQMLLFFSMFIFMLSSILINDFTEVLIDVRDNQILLPKPVGDRTIVVSKLLHIFLNVFKLILPMSLPSMVLIVFLHPFWVIIPFVIMILLATLFTVFLINLAYVVILFFVPPARFKSILSFIQIIFVVLIYASYQVIPNEIAGLEKVDLSQLSYVYIIPSYWFATAVKVLSTFNATATGWICTILALVSPFLSVWLMVKYLAPVFNKKLSGINDSVNNKHSKTKNGKLTSKARYSSLMAAIFARQSLEKTSFLFSWKMGSRSKDFYMKVYPAFGYILVMIVLLFYKKTHFELAEIKKMIADGEKISFWLISLIYFSGIMALVALAQMRYSEKYKAAWVYYISPIAQPGRILIGGLKMTFVKYFLPTVLIVGAALVYLSGWTIAPNLLLCISNVVLLLSVAMYFSEKHFPFSAFQDIAQRGGNFMTQILRFILLFGLIILHYIVFQFVVVVYIFLALSVVANWVVYDSIKKLSWLRLVEEK